MCNLTEDEKQSICNFIDEMEKTERLDPKLNKIVNDNFSSLFGGDKCLT